jgi:hypothetical protein
MLLVSNEPVFVLFALVDTEPDGTSDFDVVGCTDV